MQPRPGSPNQVIDRRHFIGGSDAWIITGRDEKALIRLWREKRGKVGPEDLSMSRGGGAPGRSGPQFDPRYQGH